MACSRARKSSCAESRRPMSSSFPSSSLVAVTWPLSNSSMDGKLDIFDKVGGPTTNTQRIQRPQVSIQTEYLYLRNLIRKCKYSTLRFVSPILQPINFSIKQLFNKTQWDEFDESEAIFNRKTWRRWTTIAASQIYKR